MVFYVLYDESLKLLFSLKCILIDLCYELSRTD